MPRQSDCPPTSDCASANCWNLRWTDVSWEGQKVTVRRNLSAGQVSTPKSGKRRDVPLSDSAAAALARLAQRPDFTAPDELVICNHLGRHLDGSALRRRYKAAQVAAGLEPLRWHDLRHTFGSRLVATGSDLVTVKSVVGHTNISTTERYLHARPATALAAEFTAAFHIASPADAELQDDPEREALEALARLDPDARSRLLETLSG